MTTEQTAEDILSGGPYTFIFVSEDEGGFSARVLEFKGCFAEGDTIAETAEKLQGAAIAWLQAVIDQGQDVPKPQGYDSHLFAGEWVRRSDYEAAKKNAEHWRKLADKTAVALELARAAQGKWHPDPEIDAEIKADCAEGRAFDAQAGIKDGWHKGHEQQIEDLRGRLKRLENRDARVLRTLERTANMGRADGRLLGAVAKAITDLRKQP